MTNTRYTDFNDSLVRAGAESSGSETHGMMCGLLCMGKTAEIPLALGPQLLPPDHSPDNPVILEFHAQLQTVHEQTVQQINDSLLEFDLIMPDESESLAIRTEALAQWCQGFIFGLGLGGYREDKSGEGDAVELIRDFAEIARAGYDDDAAADEEEERAFTEVLEYVRVGVLLILEELQPVKLQSPIVH